jgi:hypothetical protein
MQIDRPRSNRLATLASIEACNVRVVDRVAQARRSGKTTHHSLDDEHVRILLDNGRKHLRPQDGGT